MTLDLARMGPQLHEMGRHLADSRESRAVRLGRVRARFAARAGQWEELAAGVRGTGGSWGSPIEPLDAVYARPPTPAEYEVLATDGSTIEPDRHGPAMCAVINVGQVRIRYGAEPTAELRSASQLFYEPEDLYVTQGGRRVLIGERLLDARRSTAEMQALAQLGDGASAVPRVALADGLLTVWRQDWAAADAETVTRQFTEALDAIFTRRLPLAAYVSSPHSHWVVDLLRRDGCGAGRVAGCGLGCVPAECAFDGLLDVDLFGHLRPGERSGLFEVVGRDAARYGEHQRSHFCYLHAGRELARLEVPGWVAHDAAAMELLHAVVCDQAERGQGYPVALARAHEQAVISAADRRAFRQMVVEALIRAGLPVSASEKSTSKAMRAV